LIFTLKSPAVTAAAAAAAVAIVLSGSMGCSSSCGKKNESHFSPAVREKSPSDAGPVETCPLCGLKFPRSESGASMEHKGRVYYFRLKDHRDTCEKDPSFCFDSGQEEKIK